MIRVIVQKGKNRRTVYTIDSWSLLAPFLRLGSHTSIRPGTRTAVAIVTVW